MTDNILLMTGSYKVDGRWFLHNHTYEYTSSSYVLVDCDDCEHKWKKKKELHYSVEVDGVTYSIADYMCVTGLNDNELRPDEQADFEKYISEDMTKDALEDENGKTDFVEGAKLLDKYIAAKDREDQSDHNGDYLLDQIKARYPNG